MKKRINIVIFTILVMFGAILCACSSNKDDYKHTDTVIATVLNGEHYTVNGANSVELNYGDSVSFDIILDRGYRIKGVFGDKCKYSNDSSFNQTVSFEKVEYNVTTRLILEQLDTHEFVADYNKEGGTVHIESVLGAVEADRYYDNDILSLSAEPKDGFRFFCWSIGGYLSDGGEFLSYAAQLPDFDFRTSSRIFANFKSVLNTQNTITYKFDDGVEIEQDCSALIAHHPRANTYTKADIRAFVDCDSKYLVGWRTENDEYVCLGSRTKVSDEKTVELYPIWKDFSSDSLFKIDKDGYICGYEDSAEVTELVIPNKIRGIAVVGIKANAFKSSNIETIYIPDIVTTIEDNAFLNCENLRAVYISDNIKNIDDAAFTGCRNFTSLFLNAIEKPKHCDSYYGAKMDVFDQVALDYGNGRRKLVVIGGSSVANGYSGWVTKEIFDEFDIDVDFYNLGLNATFSNFLQYQAIAPYLSEGDIYVHAPESAYEPTWCGSEAQSIITNQKALEIAPSYHMLIMFESNWQFLSNVQVNMFTDVIKSLSRVLRERVSLPDSDYSRYYPLTEEGEGMRETGEYVKPECGDSDFFGQSAYAYMTQIVNRCAEFVLKNVYTPLADKGVLVYNTFPPLARQVLLNWYGTERDYEYATELYSQKVRDVLGDDKVTVLLSHNDTLYDAAHFSDHCMHLGYDYQLVHTRKIMTALAESLKDRL